MVEIGLEARSEAVKPLTAYSALTHCRRTLVRDALLNSTWRTSAIINVRVNIRISGLVLALPSVGNLHTVSRLSRPYFVRQGDVPIPKVEVLGRQATYVHINHPSWHIVPRFYVKLIVWKFTACLSSNVTSPSDSRESNTRPDDQYVNQSINKFISRHSTEARATVRLCRIKEKCLKTDLKCVNGSSEQFDSSSDRPKGSATRLVMTCAVWCRLKHNLPSHRQCCIGSIS